MREVRPRAACDARPDGASWSQCFDIPEGQRPIVEGHLLIVGEGAERQYRPLVGERRQTVANCSVARDDRIVGPGLAYDGAQEIARSPGTVPEHHLAHGRFRRGTPATDAKHDETRFGISPRGEGPVVKPVVAVP